MNSFVEVCAMVTTVLAFGYLCYVLVKPEHF
jgi:K+-transporting ATPase KdpF subunit